ncbi:MAG: carbohydrate binding family 9 domain-containing protein [Acidobacteria bacterium]|nr:carbohydrate binding family 9 domain-containing protein [Acidobacteriota bacterium]
MVIEAHRIDRPPVIDGVLDEDFWQDIVPSTGFLQRTPVDGAAASERTEVRVAYDANNIYFGLTMYDRESELIRRSILHREGRIDQDDRVIIALDTYHDKRNGYIFELNSLGTQGDAWFNDESLERSDWNWEGIYRSAARVEEWGWVLEVAIPTTTIRFPGAEEIEMGVAFYRSIRRKNEDVYLPHISQDYRQHIYQASQYATLTGLRGLRRGNDLEVKPWGLLGGEALAGETTIAGGETIAGGVTTSAVGAVGLDVKWGITSNFTADITINTDFAQVEADNVQINLTRFNLFFPEKREFFLERAPLFQFGNRREAEIFFSRRIGIDNEIIGGGRVTGQQGPWSIGVLDLQTQDAEPEGEGERKGANNFVGRVRNDIRVRSTVGAIFTNLQNSQTYNRVAGIDYEQRFFTSSFVRGWFAQVWDKEEGTEGNAAGFVEAQFQSRLYTAGVSYTDIGENFNPALGFVRRRDMVRWEANVGVHPRFEQSGWARRLSINFGGNEIKGQDGVLQSQFVNLHPNFVWESGDTVLGTISYRFERLFEPFFIRPDASIPPGDYNFTDVFLQGRTNESRRLSVHGTARLGEFWNGTIRAYGGSFTWKHSEHLSFGLGGDFQDISLPTPSGDFSTTIITHRIGLAASRDLFANALIQYDTDSDVVQANIRIDWIHTPGSDLFIVFDTGYNIGVLADPRDTRWANRTGVIKLTYLKAF